MADPKPSSRAFTIIELVVAMVVMSVIAGVITPVIVSATDDYAASRDLRTAVDDGAFAIDAMVRIIRAAPGDAGGLDLTSADAQSFIPATGRGFTLTGTTLELVTPAGNAPLARDVRAFELVYLLEDGITQAATPADAHRIHISADIGGLSLSAAVFPRINIGGGS